MSVQQEAEHNLLLKIMADLDFWCTVDPGNSIVLVESSTGSPRFALHRCFVNFTSSSVRRLRDINSIAKETLWTIRFIPHLGPN